jgi:hypothetical protein
MKSHSTTNKVFSGFYKPGAISVSAILHITFVFSLFIILSSCGSSNSGDKLDTPSDMPEICHGIDFKLNVEMREICGVRLRNYRAYKNIQQYRVLLQPKGAKIVKSGDNIALELPKTLPIALPEEFLTKIQFDESFRQELIKNKLDYQEFFPKGSNNRIKMMKILIPFKDGTQGALCYEIPKRAEKVSKVQMGYASSLKDLPCKIFEEWKLGAEAQDKE